MGTRNVTIIKYNGEEKVRQYGQWDGYPTTALASIVDFLRNKNFVKKLKQNVIKCKFANSVIMDDQTFITIADKQHKLYSMLPILTYNEKIKLLMQKTDKGMHDVFCYFLDTMDTGYNIVKVLITDAADEATEIFVAKAYTNECDWQIEAVNVIDLDNNQIISEWHGKKMTWGFDCLPDENEIQEFENAE